MTRRAMPSPCCAGNAGLESYGTRDLLRAGGSLLLAGAGANSDLSVISTTPVPHTVPTAGTRRASRPLVYGMQH